MSGPEERVKPIADARATAAAERLAVALAARLPGVRVTVEGSVVTLAARGIVRRSITDARFTNLAEAVR